MSRGPQTMIDPLEPRRMLAFTAQGTSGDDLIEVVPAGQHGMGCTIRVNGQDVGTTQQTDIRLSGLGGFVTFIIGAVGSQNDFSEPYTIELSGGTQNDAYRIEGTGAVTLEDQLQ